MKKYTAIIVMRENVWIHIPTGQPANPTSEQKLLQGFTDHPILASLNVYTKLVELKADRLAELGDLYYEYLRNHSGIFSPTYAASNTVDAELIITHKGKVATGNTTIFNQ